MNVLDIVFLAVIVVFLIWGLFRGLVKEVVTTAGVLAAYWVANTYYRSLAPEMRYWLSDPSLMSMVAYFALFVGTFVLAWLVSYLLVKVFRIMPPAWIMFPGGAVFGAVKGVLICAVALVSLNSFLPDSALIKESKLAVRLEPLTKVMERFAPGHMTSYDPSILRDSLMEQSQEFRDKLLGNGEGGDTSDAERADEAAGKEDEGLPDQVKEMKDKILKGVQEMMNKEQQ